LYNVSHWNHHGHRDCLRLANLHRHVVFMNHSSMFHFQPAICNGFRVYQGHKVLLHPLTLHIFQKFIINNSHRIIQIGSKILLFQRVEYLQLLRLLLLPPT
jgi:hypothetical protein